MSWVCKEVFIFQAGGDEEEEEEEKKIIKN